jgi:hypothetical protein
MDKRFISVIEKRGLDPAFYKEVFETCCVYTKLRGDKYWIGMSLHDMGLMSIKRVPVHNKENSFIGVDVFFKSMYESENNNCDHYFTKTKKGWLPCEFCEKEKT